MAFQNSLAGRSVDVTKAETGEFAVHRLPGISVFWSSEAVLLRWCLHKYMPVSILLELQGVFESIWKIFSLSFCCLLTGEMVVRYHCPDWSVGGNGELLALWSALRTSLKKVLLAEVTVWLAVLILVFIYFRSIRLANISAHCCWFLLQTATPSAASWQLWGTVTFEEMSFQLVLPEAPAPPRQPCMLLLLFCAASYVTIPAQTATRCKRKSVKAFHLLVVYAYFTLAV